MDEVTRVSGDLAVSTGSPSASGAGEGCATALERYKLSLRRYAPVQKGLAGLPWEGEWLCGRCGETAPGRLIREPDADAIVARARLPAVRDLARAARGRPLHDPEA